MDSLLRLPCCCKRHAYRENVSLVMVNMPCEERKKPLDWRTRVQLDGLLYKKPFGHQSTKWSRRFFILKDGYLLYYSDSEKKEIDKHQFLNIHPKGVIPLGNCQVTPSREPGQPFAFILKNADIDGQLLLAAESEFERGQWMEMLQKASMVTWKAVQLSDAMIKQLEDQGRKIAQEKQNYFDRMQSEIVALTDEKEKAEELKRLNKELAKEKNRMEEHLQEMREEHSRIKMELDETAEQMRHLKDGESLLLQKLQDQETQLQDLEREKKRVMADLEDKEGMAKSLSEKNVSLSQSSDRLRQKLAKIERDTEKILEEKALAESELQENRERTREMEEEKDNFSEHARELQDTIKDLTAQKELTEVELKEEIMARMDAEKKLREAENSVVRLDQAVTHETPNIKTEVKEEMMFNVKKLKCFFEDLAIETAIDANKPILIKNMVHARKTLARRAKTLKFEKRRKSNRDRAKSMNLDLLPSNPCNYENRRSETTIVRSSRQTVSDLSMMFGKNL